MAYWEKHDRLPIIPLFQYSIIPFPPLIVWSVR